MRLNRFLLVLVMCATAPAAEDLLIQDFENMRDVQKKEPERKWTFENRSFDREARGDFREVNRYGKGSVLISGFQGKTVLTSMSEREIDLETGRALSPKFNIARKYVKFLICGGRYPGRTCLNLVVDGKIVRSATGDHSGKMKEVAFDVAAFQGKSAQIEVLDQERQLWGHISVDHIVQSDVPAAHVIDKMDRIVVPQATVHTAGGLRSGRLKVSDGRLLLDGTSVALEDIICVNFNPVGRGLDATHLVRLVNGDMLSAAFSLDETGKLRLDGAVIGKHEMDLKDVAQLDFNAAEAGASSRRPGYLYREEGDPIPGKLVKIENNSIDFECPLGMLKLPREGLVHYGFEKEKVESGRVDELGLIDGSVLRGTLTLDGENLVLDHPALKSMAIAWDRVRYLKRSRGDVTWLHEVADVKTELKGAPFPPAAPHTVEGDGPFLNVMRVGASTTARYALPVSEGRRIFRTVLAPVRGIRGEVMVALQMGGRSVFKETLGSKHTPKALSLDLPAGDALVVEVDFGKRLTFPCGIDLGDAYVVAVQP